MKQYNRIMLGEHGRYLNECLAQNFIGANFLPETDLANTPYNDEVMWRKQMVATYLQENPDKSIGTARNSIGYLWTICFGLKKDDMVIASNGQGGYHVGIIDGNYIYVPGGNLPHRRSVVWLNNVISRKSMSQKLQYSTGSIGTCCNITKYAEELETLIGGKTVTNTAVADKHSNTFKERSLHKLLAHYLIEKNRFPKTIFHETSSKADQAQKWIHPDMVAVEFNEFQSPTTQAFLKAADTKTYVDLFSYELKCRIENDHQLKEYFFQALSNSNWANYGYLVAFEISDDVMEEMERLNRAFGIGIILLSPFSNDTRELFQARKKKLDYYTIDKLSRINPDFKNFIVKTTKVLNSQNDVVEDVKNGLQKFCDKGFASEDEIAYYCNETNIPLK